MALLFKQRIKIIMAVFFIIFASFIIYMQMTKPVMAVSKISTNEKESKLQVKSNLASNYDVKLYQKTKEDKEFTEVKAKENERSILKKVNTFEINTEDKAKPNNITNIKSSIVDDYIIISFEEAKDNGTEYEYYLSGNKKDESIETEISKVYSISGIKGYNYIIDNNPNTEAGFEVNKENSEAILYSGISWNKNYYLHIRTIDNNNNFSENLNYKINLPSKGIKMQYIDLNNHSELSPEETIIGNANDEYNVTEYNKKVEGYQLINTDGEEIGILKKERINIKYMYAKDANITVKYINKLTGKEIAKETIINGYEGKEYVISPKKIDKYEYNGAQITGKMAPGNNEISLYYDEISSVNISYINYSTGKEIIKQEKISGKVGTTYECNSKEIEGYELYKVEGNEKGEIETNINNITYYYKEKVNLIVKHVDVDNNKELEREIMEGYSGDKITIKPKEFEGYVLKDNNEGKYEITKENIIDELLENEQFEKIDISDKTDKISNGDKNEKILDNYFQQYDIVMSCGKSEYIIYYKKM